MTYNLEQMEYISYMRLGGFRGLEIIQSSTLKLTSDNIKDTRYAMTLTICELAMLYMENAG